MSDFRYAAEKFSAARRTLMAPHPKGEAESWAGAFFECSLGLRHVNDTDLDDNSRLWVARVREALDTAGIVDDGTQRGTWATKIERLSEDERRDLASAIDALAYWFDQRSE